MIVPVSCPPRWNVFYSASSSAWQKQSELHHWPPEVVWTVATLTLPLAPGYTWNTPASGDKSISSWTRTAWGLGCLHLIIFKSSNWCTHETIGSKSFLLRLDTDSNIWAVSVWQCFQGLANEEMSGLDVYRWAGLDLTQDGCELLESQLCLSHCLAQMILHWLDSRLPETAKVGVISFSHLGMVLTLRSVFVVVLLKWSITDTSVLLLYGW